MIGPVTRMMALWVPDPDADPDHARRRWETALAALEEIVPGMRSDTVGSGVVRARGPVRYYGGEADAARTVRTVVLEQGFETAAVGIADGRFAAEQAAHAAEGAPGIDSPECGIRLVSSDRTTEFLASIPVSTVADEALAETLFGLGIRTLGAFAALPASAVLERFGEAGADAHRLASGLDPRRGTPGAVQPRHGEHRTTFGFDTPLDDTDRLAFASRTHAEEFVRHLAERGLVCTELRVEFVDDEGGSHERTWAHPVRFTAADVVNRIRWQAGALVQPADRSGAGIAEVHLIAPRTARASDHEPGLWSTAADERIHHHLTRVQNLLGYEGVCTGELLGGRSNRERQRLVPWGSPLGLGSRASTRDAPWPGHLTGPLPSVVHAEALPVSLLDAGGGEVDVDDDDLLVAVPALLRLSGAAGGRERVHEVGAWSSPWPLRERHWVDAESAATTAYRLQVLLRSGEAWLLRYERNGITGASGWTAEGRYS